jgi:hypothetical protein
MNDRAAAGDESAVVELKFNGRELERMVAVAGDLEFLQSMPQHRLLTHTEVRLAAGVLRRLLIDGQIAALLKSAVSTPPALTVEAVDIDTPLSEWPPEWIRYAFAGGAAVSGAHHTGVLLGVVPKAEHEPYGSPEAFLEAHPLPMAGTSRRMSLAAFLESTCVAVGTNEVGLVKISRRVVLQYIANRKGGVHFDPHRDLSLKDVKKWRREAAYHLMDHGLLRVGHLSGPEFEIQSMARAIAEADWAREVVRVAAEVAPDDFGGDPNELKVWTGMQEADGTGWATSTFAPQAQSEVPPA